MRSDKTQITRPVQAYSMTGKTRDGWELEGRGVDELLRFIVTGKPENFNR